MIVGVDPGLKNVGVAILGDDGSYRGSAMLELCGYEEPGWCAALIDRLMGVVQQYGRAGGICHVLACESAFVGRNAKLALQLAHVAGAVESVAVILGMMYMEIRPAATRKALTGNGSAADWRALQKAREFAGRDDLTIHEADALGVALAAWNLTRKEKGDGS